MKRLVSTLTLTAILVLGTSQAFAGIIVSTRTEQSKKNKAGIIVSTRSGIIVSTRK